MYLLKTVQNETEIHSLTFIGNFTQLDLQTGWFCGYKLKYTSQTESASSDDIPPFSDERHRPQNLVGCKSSFTAKYIQPI